MSFGQWRRARIIAHMNLTPNAEYCLVGLRIWLRGTRRAGEIRDPKSGLFRPALLYDSNVLGPDGPMAVEAEVIEFSGERADRQAPIHLGHWIESERRGHSCKFHKCPRFIPGGVVPEEA